jgi:ubiquinone biosynthesis monooxygenase Coq7
MTSSTTPLIDRLVLSLDRAVKTLSPGTARAQRANPAGNRDEAALDDNQRKHIAGLMRVNHTGEVCAQALYQGQALTARLPDIKDAMASAADEEIDHLAWCEDRLRELGSHTSVLNPAFYALSFGIGAAAGIAGDKWSLGFVAATEQQVCKHLESHLQQLPDNEHKSRQILQQMLQDEQHHATSAMDAGGVAFAGPVKRAMSLLSQVMTRTTYRI